ncbi:MAG TPA: hypothetical protein PK788_00145 [Gemmatimonadaceae bacterium]|nr:hypothetical protein [Gemmatimonadaceae bacterium]HRQ77614.1 hypothetical protein [Gemmatimonadaceae bacterium]
MTERSTVILELARNELLGSGEDAASHAVLSVGFPLLRAGRALDEVLAVHRATPDDRAALQRAAHRAIGALEAAYGRLQRVRHVEAYQVLLNIAYS